MNKEQALFRYCLRLGDTSLIAGHRLSEWCGHGPILEEDIAMTNIALDLVGQSRTMLQHAGKIEGKARTEDDFAYLRGEREFYNALLVEQPNGDFAVTLVKNFFFSVFNYFLYSELQNSKDETMAAFAAKSLKEVSYHLRHTSDWMVRLGDGTEESHSRVQKALNDLWMFTDDLFAMDETDEILIKDGSTVDLSGVKLKWQQKVKEVLEEATLKMPQDGWMQKGSKEGKHSEHLGYLLAEMQSLPRAYPNATW
ncbi:MAG: phenylacetate-CoA oxygenase subunit PaaI [Flavobacteriales bacterium]|nr:MAG: phenylacetate-CoA oxygenase subunit PaaI [Flavobacteriales bacterium]